MNIKLDCKKQNRRILLNREDKIFASDECKNYSLYIYFFDSSEEVDKDNLIVRKDAVE